LGRPQAEGSAEVDDLEARIQGEGCEFDRHIMVGRQEQHVQAGIAQNAWGKREALQAVREWGDFVISRGAMLKKDRLDAGVMPQDRDELRAAVTRKT
jgi:hypothetical protein